MNVKELNANSNIIDFPSSVDADGLERYIKHNSQHLLQESGYQSENTFLISGNAALSVIPNNIVNIVFGGYNNSSLTNLSFSNYAFNQLESIVIGNSSFKDAKIDVVFSGLPKLKSLVIGSECFQNATSFLIEGLSSLETVKIGSQCFYIDGYGYYSYLKSFHIINCNQLLEILIGSYCASASHCKIFDLINLNSLKSIKMENNCFSGIESFVIQSTLLVSQGIMN